MNATQIRKFLELLDQLVNEAAPYQEKKAALEAEASETDVTNISEFCSWFELFE